MSEAKKARETLMLEKIIERLKTVYDPEIPVSIYDLGLIYRIDVEQNDLHEAKFDIHIDMTLTAPGCPMAELLPQMAHNAVSELEQSNEVTVVLVWDPPWDKSRMSEEARMELGMF